MGAYIIREAYESLQRIGKEREMATKTEKALLTRKAWVIQEIGWEFNDEYYYRGNSEGGIPQKVYFFRDKAYEACALLNAKRQQEELASEYPMEGTDGYPIKEFYEIVEVEVA